MIDSSFERYTLLLILLIIWSLIWKGFALWASARKDQKYWFIAILLVNSMGILEMIYFFSEKYRVRKQKLLKKPSKY
jgi:hypothetical protein